MTTIKGLKGERGSNDVVVTLGSAHPVCVAIGDRGKPLQFLEAQEQKDPQFCPSLPPAAVSGLGKQEDSFQFFASDLLPLLLSWGGSQDGSPNQRLAHL